jgi:RecA-family ATPase
MQDDDLPPYVARAAAAWRLEQSSRVTRLESFQGQRTSTAPATRLSVDTREIRQAQRADKPRRELRILDPTHWEGQPVPERRWRVLNLIPERAVTILSGPGAAGKSTIAMQLQVAMATGTPWLGFQTTPGRSLLLSAEDNENELHRRMDAVRTHYSTDFRTIGEHCRLVELVGQDAVLVALKQGKVVKPTELYGLVESYVAEWRPGLVTIDALADVFGGDEIVRAQVRQFITTPRRLCVKYACEVLLLAHPSLNGMAPGGTGLSGSTGWGNSARQVLYFEHPPKKEGDAGKPLDDGLRTLSARKANYTAQGESLTVKYENGVFVPQGTAGALDRKAHERKAEEVFLELLSAYTAQGRYVSPSPCSTYAPKEFETEEAALKAGLNKAMLKLAMKRLFATGRLAIGQHGKESDPRKHIEIVEQVE